MKRKERSYRELHFVIIAVIGILILSVSIWIIGSYFEAKTFTKLTGREVSVLDAMFVQLRVIGPVK